MPLDLVNEKGPISLQDPGIQDVLDDLQGNILNGHGRDQALHLFLQFNSNRIADVKQKISSMSNGYITSAKRQLLNSEHFKKTGEDGGVFIHLSLSGKGYEALQIQKIPEGVNLRKRNSAREITNPDCSKSNVPFYNSKVFTEGMKSRQSILQDEHIKNWDLGFQEEIHALLILADDNNLELIEAEKQFRAFVNAGDDNYIMKVVTIERGFGLRKEFYVDGKKYGENVEHFGFADGRSQPALLNTQLSEETERDGTRIWDPTAPPNLVLLQDPSGKEGVSFGSFLVFRKLEQDVKGFYNAVRDVAKETGSSPDLIAAAATGRFQDGTPLVLQPGEDADPAIPNDFDYSSDPGGVKCPFFSHTRKTNPRGESFVKGGFFAESLEEERGHRIARRGIPYGGGLSKDFNDLASLPSKGVGLLFMCYQSDIWEQFEFIQRFWSNNNSFLQPGLIGNSNAAPDYIGGTGLDAITGQQIARNKDSLIGLASAPQNWPSEWGKSLMYTKQSIAQFVKLKGGEYFFSPSLSFLENLAVDKQAAKADVLTPPNLYPKKKNHSKRINKDNN